MFTYFAARGKIPDRRGNVCSIAEAADAFINDAQPTTDEEHPVRRDATLCMREPRSTPMRVSCKH
jgi:hypothetical protein